MEPNIVARLDQERTRVRTALASLVEGWNVHRSTCDHADADPSHLWSEFIGDAIEQKISAEQMLVTVTCAVDVLADMVRSGVLLPSLLPSDMEMAEPIKMSHIKIANDQLTNVVRELRDKANDLDDRETGLIVATEACLDGLNRRTMAALIAAALKRLAWPA